MVSILCPLCIEEVTETHRDVKSLLLFLNLGCSFFFLYYSIIKQPISACPFNSKV